ncbi:MAG TPA: Ig-like domain-containing protein, partial [Verrucomicrobiae bacterium]|nr:Ig-like domain-containing protein [Verrucomicrobiae bacterium]
MRSVEVCRRGWLLATIALFSLVTTTVRAVNLVEEFYLPLPEPQVLQAAKAITPAVADTSFAAITAILVTGDGTQIIYDQWEDGYEGDLANPTNSTTQIWGDGIDSNGIAPGFAHDPVGLPSGTVLILSNSVPSSPRVASQYYYDGRDRIGANKALVITRAGWPSPTGPVFGGSAVVQPTIDWGTNYVSPIGQDMTDTLFRYTSFFVMASQDNTMVIIDPDGSGPLQAVTNVLNQGESWYYTGGVRRGGTINASKPVEAHIICGDTTTTYAIDWFTLYPQSDWSSSYYTPVPSVKNYSTAMYFYNNTATSISIFYTNLVATNNFVLPANGGYKFVMPTNSGSVFVSAAGEKFTTLCTVANGGTGGANDTDYNWGFTPLPKGSLTTEAFTGWAPGTSDYSGNGSPVWVTPTANTRLYVDYHGDHSGPLTDPNGNKYDTNFDLTVFQSKTIYVPGTNDQTGLRVYTIDGTLLSVVWGEDPAVAGTGNPYLDLGNPVLPFPVPRLTKSAIIVTDAPPAGLSTGDTLLYTVQVDNRGLLPLGNTVVVDAPPPALNYLTNSTTFNGQPIPDSATGTPFPLDTPGYTIPIILSGGTTIIQYKAVVVASGSIQNSAGIPGYNVNVTNTVPAAAPVPSFFVSKTILSPSTGVAGVGQTMQFNIQVINNGTAPLPNYSVTDNYPTNLSYVTATPAPNVTAGGQIVWSNLGTLANGASTNLVVSLLVNSTNFLATNTAIAASPGNTTNSGSVTFTNLAKPVAAVTVNKTLISPASGSAGIGQTIQYNLQVYNSGYATLTNLSLVDAFPRANVSYSSASVTPNIVTTNALTWTNLGSFTPGQITNITVSFLVTNYSATIVNSATAASVGGATNTGSASLSLSHSGLTVTKTVLSPTNQPVNLGSNVVFRIVIQNSGTAGITNVPLEDTYSADYFQYVSATIPPNSIARGDLLWTNLAGPGGFVAGATITNDVTFLVTGGATPAKNTAAVSYAVDVNNAAVAPASSVAAVNTAAGSISGNVYSDPDQSGTLTAGDSSLQNVNLALYTDPNGDGNPADGTLLQTVSTDANGYYELLNLSTGAFVVVQSILPGYTGTAPANNRRAVLISTLTATTNQNFFQYSVPATNYSTVAGTVWNDVNDVGFFQAGDTGLTNVQVDLIQDFNTNGVVDSGETAVQTVFTATNGTYIFTGVAPGHYVIRETDLSGYISTGDTQGTNDNQIAIALANGVATNGNDFFDFYYGLSNSNSPPVAVPDFVSTLQNVPLTIFPLANDNSPGGFSLTITNVSPTNGIASIIGGTNVLFTPVLNFTGTATIGYTITNANGKSTALITITVAPAANLSLGKTAAATVLATSNFVYTISVTNAGPSSATGVTVTDALPVGVTFVSASGSGANSGGVVTWNLGTLVSNQVTNVTVTVTAPTSGTLTNVASGGSPVGDPNPTNNTSTPITTTVTPIANLAIVKLAPATVLANSNFSYSISVTNMGPSPAPNVVVTDTLPVGVTFVTASGSGTSAGGLVTWNLGTVAALQVTNLTLTVTAPVTGVTLTNVASVSSPAVDPVPTNGVTPPVITAVTPMADLSITKTGPAANALGSNYSYTLTVSNAGPSVAANLLVTDSLPVGLTFVSSVPTTTTNASRQVIWNLSSFAIGTSNLTLTVFASQRGSLTNIASLGSPTFDPTPTNRTTPPVVIAITNRPPVAVNDSNSTPKNVAVTVPVLANDSDPDGDTLTIVSVASTNGLASISGANIIYTPTNNFLGPVTLVYTISDGFGGTNSAFIFVSVTNRPPVAVNDPANTVENVAVTVPVLANDSDPDGDTLTIISVNPTNGTALISGTNVIFTPATNFVGTAMVDYSITDNFGGTNSALITISVTNRPPVANPDNVSITENTTNTFTPLTNDVVRTPGGALTIISVSPTNGTATIIGGTNVVFVPNTNFVGTATIGYTITDGVGGTNTSLITVSVSNIP